jgi:hypothetical protein
MADDIVIKALVKETKQELDATKAPIIPCTIPPPGWVCTRPVGHDGPCAATLGINGEITGDLFWDSNGDEYVSDTAVGLLAQMHAPDMHGNERNLKDGQRVTIMRAQTLPSIDVIVHIDEGGEITCTPAP